MSVDQTNSDAVTGTILPKLDNDSIDTPTNEHLEAGPFPAPPLEEDDDLEEDNNSKEVVEISLLSNGPEQFAATAYNI